MIEYVNIDFVKSASSPFHVMTKPMGPLCNLDCKYCFYLEKARLFPANERFKMSDKQLEHFVRSYIEAQPGEVVSFAWQGGEPTLAGVDFYKKAVGFQKKYGGGKTIENAFQTNGTLLDDAFCEFFAGEGFLVGISVDGPQAMHDFYRVDRGGRPTYREVIRGLNLCSKHKVEFNTLTVVHRHNADHPIEVYRHLRELGSRYIQFIPLVERAPDAASKALELGLAHPPEPKGIIGAVPGAEEPLDLPEVTEWSVRPAQLGQFFNAIFDRWVSRDVGRVFVQLFDSTLGKWVGAPGGPCTMAETCGRALAMEHNGDLYACDHYVYPRYLMGNVHRDTLAAVADSAAMRRFGNAKRDTLTGYCKRCQYRFACNGDCPKHRFASSPDGEFGLSYLCQAYFAFFEHSASAMRQMAALYHAHRPVDAIMQSKTSG